MARNSIVEEPKHNHLAKGTKLKGEIYAEGDFRVDGDIDGTFVCSGKLVVGESGRIFGEVECKNAEVMGHIRGKLIVADLLSMKATSKVEGDVKTVRISIEPHAVFSGSCDMISSDAENNVNE